MEFGRNGSVLGTDSETEREFTLTARRDVDLCVMGVVQICAYAAVVVYLSLTAREAFADPFVLAGILAGFFGAISPTLYAFSKRAVEDHRLPERFGSRPKHHHISGWLTACGVIVLAGVVTLAIEASAKLSASANMEIPNFWGVLVLVAVTAAFLGAIFGPRLSDTTFAYMIREIAAEGNNRFAGLGRAASIVDSWLVYVVAPAVGVTQRRTRVRYSLLIANLAPCCMAAWFLPAPLGLAPIVWAFIVVMAVARRWAWVEDDREIAMLNGNFASENLRVGFDEDLSDETLWSYLSLMVLLPVAMHQCNQWGGGDLFAVKAGVAAEQIQNPFAWLTYYGTELAKSVPFVDWSEIYDVHSASDITLNKPEARHVIFGVRAITDLVLVAALFQALGIAARTRKQKELFHDPHNPLDRLDPFVEPIELKALVEYRKGEWRAIRNRIEKFPKYNSARLHEIRTREEKGSALYVAATALLSRQYPEESDAGERLMEFASASPPNPGDILLAFQRYKKEGVFDLDILEYVRRALNWKAGHDLVRAGIVELIVDAIHLSTERTTVLRYILADAQVRDSLASSRLRVLDPLFQAWEKTADERVASAFKAAAASDASSTVRRQAADLLGKMGQTPPVAPEPAPA